MKITLDSYRHAILQYNTQVELFKAKAEVYSAAMKNQLWGASIPITPDGAAMSTPRKVYEVYEATNGYYAQLESGKVVVGKTLAEVTADANAAVTEEMTEVGTGATPDDPLAQKGVWHKGLHQGVVPPHVDLAELEKLLATIDIGKGAKIKLYKGKPPPVDTTSEVSGAGYTREGESYASAFQGVWGEMEKIWKSFPKASKPSGYARFKAWWK